MFTNQDAAGVWAWLLKAHFEDAEYNKASSCLGLFSIKHTLGDGVTQGPPMENPISFDLLRSLQRKRWWMEAGSRI